VLRLVSGSATTSGSTRLMQGRVEVRLWNGRWTSVCHDRFSDASASVVCRQVRGEGCTVQACSKRMRACWICRCSYLEQLWCG